MKKAWTEMRAEQSSQVVARTDIIRTETPRLRLFVLSRGGGTVTRRGTGESAISGTYDGNESTLNGAINCEHRRIATTMRWPFRRGYSFINTGLSRQEIRRLHFFPQNQLLKLDKEPCRASLIINHSLQ